MSTNTKRRFHYCVVGCGGIGSGALYWLSKRLNETTTRITHDEQDGTLFNGTLLGIEQFKLGHHNGASQDHSRIVRLAYDDDAYTPLAPHSYSAWRAVEAEAGFQLVTKTGSLIFGDRNLPHLQRYIDAIKKSGIYMDVFYDMSIARKRFPQFTFGDNDVVVHQPDGGFVDARKANATHISLAVSNGAQILEETKVERIRKRTDKDLVELDLSSGETIEVKRVVLTTDAWTNDLLKSLSVPSLPLRVTQEQVTYFNVKSPLGRLKDFTPDQFPVWIAYEKNNKTKELDCFYGLPIHGEIATKAGKHQGGDTVTATSRTFVPNSKVEEETADFLRRNIPASAGTVLYTKTCLYTLLPDDNFVIDKVPGVPQVSLALGAGHSFKFASIIGLILSELAMYGKTVYPISPFSFSRPALKNTQSKL